MHNHPYDTLVEAQAGVRSAGYTEEFTWDEGALKSADKTRAYGRDDLAIVEHYRFEGASDPGDLSILLALEATDGTRGYAISGYGTYADEKFVTFLDELPVRDSTRVEDTP